MNKTLLLTLLILFSRFVFLSAQEVGKSDLYTQYEKAKSLAYHENREAAIHLCKLVLQSHSDFHDMRILLARIYAWNREFQKSRHEIQYVLERDPQNNDALLVLIDVEHWTKHLEKSLLLCNQYLQKLPTDLSVLFRKYKIHLQLNEQNKAFSLLEEILKIDPSNAEAKKSLKSLQKTYRHANFHFEYTYDYFEEPYLRRWHVNSFQYEKRYSFGKVIGKLNVGDLVHESESYLAKDVNYQFELEAYPVLSKKNYMFLNYACSFGELFPKHRAGMEFFQKFPYEFWGSAGVRFLQFDSGETKNVYIYTASIEKYYRNYWFAFRTYLSSEKNDLNQTYLLNARRYLRNSQQFFGIELGTGINPDEARGNISSLKYYEYNSWKFRLSYQDRFLSERLHYRLSFGIEQEEYEVKNYRDVFTVSLRLSYQI